MDWTEADRATEGFRRALIAVQITIADRFTPAMNRAAISMEIFGARAAGEWNRYQMVGWRRTDLPQ